MDSVKKFDDFINESTNNSGITEKHFCSLAQLYTQYNCSGSAMLTPKRVLNHKDLQFYNKKWIYGYDVYFDNKDPRYMQFPIIGVSDNIGKAFIMYNEDDVVLFGKHCMEQDDSIFTIEITKETKKAKTSNYQYTENEMYSEINKDKTIFWGKNNEDSYTLIRYKK